VATFNENTANFAYCGNIPDCPSSGCISGCNFYKGDTNSSINVTCCNKTCHNNAFCFLNACICDHNENNFTMECNAESSSSDMNITSPTTKISVPAVIAIVTVGGVTVVTASIAFTYYYIGNFYGIARVFKLCCNRKQIDDKMRKTKAKSIETKLDTIDEDATKNLEL